VFLFIKLAQRQLHIMETSMSMSIALADVLIELADPKELEKFESDPAAYIAGTDLTESDRAALLSNHQDRIDMRETVNQQTKGELTVVGTGIQLGHATLQARAWIANAEKVLYCVGDSATERWIQKTNPSAESLYVYYGDDKNRLVTYSQMVDRTLECVRQGLKVCMVYYGHPGIFVYPSHEAVRRARAEGYKATMLPAVSSLDCLFADLGVDPGTGCQMIEATDLLVRKRAIDTAVSVIIWQAGAVGDLGFNFKGIDGRNLPVLQEYLADIYGADCECTVYEAAVYPVCEPVIRRTKVSELTSARLTRISTLFFAPQQKAPFDLKMVDRLGLYDAVNAIKDKLITVVDTKIGEEIGA
jgi:hypothetical protein